MFKAITRAQRLALYRKYIHGDLQAKGISYRQFRKTVEHGHDCIMVLWCGMWLGIEPDGYTHS